ncbi:MAG: DUF4402 domain-containing protein [Flavobacteriaceae bacterium]|nr:DUF4402 domain-containing protein [Flavobacteriaceae bacterium]
MKNIFISSLILLGITFSANAQTSTSAASANLASTMTITNTQTLHFGDITVPTTASVVELEYTYDGGARVVQSGNAVLIATNVGQPAKFDITGEALVAYNITLPASVVIVNGGDNMTVNSLKFDAEDIGDISNPVEVPADGTDTFEVVGTLNIGTGLAAGAYTANYDVTVAYN